MNTIDTNVLGNAAIFLDGRFLTEKDTIKRPELLNDQRVQEWRDGFEPQAFYAPVVPRKGTFEMLEDTQEEDPAPILPWPLPSASELKPEPAPSGTDAARSVPALTVTRKRIHWVLLRGILDHPKNAQE